MDVLVLEIAGDPERSRPRLHQRQRRLGALLHHVAELAGEDQPAAARRAARLDEQDVAADRRPGEAGRDARQAGPLRHLVLEARRPEVGGKVTLADADRGRLAFGDTHRGMAEDCADLALQTAHPGLAGIEPDDGGERRLVDGALLGGQPVGGELAPDQVALGDLQLFLLGVAGQPDDLHAVAQRARDGVQHVGGADEHHLAEVERHAEIVVAEGAVLLGIEHLEQGGSGIAVEAALPQLVHLVQHQHAVAGARLADRLDDVAGQRAEIGAAVAADLGLVMGAAEADPGELAAGGPRDALAERGLADAGRPDEAQDRALAVGVELAHREELEDPALDLLQAEMVGIEDAPRLGDVDRRLAGLRPGQLDQPVEVGAHHRGFAGLAGHALEPGKLLVGLLLDLRRHAGLGDRLAQVAELRPALVGLAELLLDGLELFAEQIFALLAFHRVAGLLADVARQAQHLDAMGEQPEQLVEPLHEVEGRQDVLLFGRLQVHEPGDEVSELGRLLDVLHRLCQLGRRVGQKLQRVERALLQLLGARLDLGAGRGAVRHALDPRHQEGVVGQVFDDAEALLALADHVVIAVRRRQIAQDGGHRADLEEVARRRVVDGRVALQDDTDGMLGTRRLLRRGDRFRPAETERQDNAGEQHQVARRHDDQRVGRQHQLGRRLALGRGHRDGRRAFRLDRITQLVHGRPRSRTILASPSIRQPLAKLRSMTSKWPGGSSMWRSNRPAGISSRRIAAPRTCGGSERTPATIRRVPWIAISTCSPATPGNATTTQSARSVSNRSTGGSHTAFPVESG